MPGEIRQATPRDIDALIAIENGAFTADRISRRSLSRLLLRRSAETILCGTEEGVAGYATVLLREGSAVARLYSIAASPSAEKTGVGRRLLAAAEEAALARGRTRMRLEVREDNARAIELYERNGYRPIGRRPGYYADGRAALRYEKALGGVPA